MAEDNVRVIGETFLKLGFKFDAKSFEKAMQDADAAGKAYNNAVSGLASSEAKASSNKEEEKEAASGDKGFTKYTQQLGGTFDKLSSEGMKILQGIFGIIKGVAAKLEEASPILQAVHTLFNLAMQLFFMPIGNKLGEVMIPAVLDMIDQALAFWDEIEGGGLTDIIEKAMGYLVNMLADYFWELGDSIEAQLQGKDNILGSIATFLKTMSGIMRELPTLINTGLKIMQWVLDNIGTLIGVIVAFKAASIAMQMAQLVATLYSAGGWKGLVAGLGATAVIGMIGGVAGASIAGSALSNSSSVYSSSKNNGSSSTGGTTPAQTDDSVSKEFQSLGTKLEDVTEDAVDDLVSADYDNTRSIVEGLEKNSTGDSYVENNEGDTTNTTLNNLTTTINNLDETLNTFNDTANTFNETMNYAGDVTQDLSSTVSEIANTTQTFNDTANAFTESISTVNNTTQDLSETVSNISNTAQEFNNSTSSLTESINTINTTNQALSESVSNISNSTENLNNTISNVTNTAQDLSSTISEITNTTQEFNNTTNALTKSIYTVNETTQDLSSTISEITNTSQTFNDTTNELTETINNMTETAQDLSTDISNVTNATEELYTTTYNTQSEVSQAYSTVTYDNKDMSSITSNLSSVTSNIDMSSITQDLSSHNTSSTVNNYNIVNNGMTETQLNKTIFTVAGTTSSQSQLQR